MTNLTVEGRTLQVGVQLTPKALFTAAGVFAVAGALVWAFTRR